MIVDTATGTRVTGFYRGKVVEHGDSGKCRIFIPGVYPESWIDEKNHYKLPYAEQANSIGFDNNRDNGFFTYPDINSIVWCFFANEDQNYPVYFATCQGATNKYGTIYDSEHKNASPQVNFINFGNLRLDFIKNDVYDNSSDTPKLVSSNPSIKISTRYKSKDGGLDNANALIEIDGNGNIHLSTTEDISLSGNNITISANKVLSLNSASQLGITAKNDMIIDSIDGYITFNAVNGLVSMATKWTRTLTGLLCKKIF